VIETEIQSQHTQVFHTIIETPSDLASEIRFTTAWHW